MAWGESITGTLLIEVQDVRRSLLEIALEVDEGRFHTRPDLRAPSIAFHLWHTARWADMFQARFWTFSDELARFGPREELWASMRVAARWGFTSASGTYDTGWGLDDYASAALPLPGRDDILDYASVAFEHAEAVFGEVRDEELLVRTGNFYDDDEWTVLDHFLWYVGHSGRHLGMIEALKGVLGMRGSATS